MRWTDITKALASLGLPAVLVAVLDMTYRYLYLFLLLFFEYILGRKSRLIGQEAHADKLSWIGGTIADFLRLTQEYSRDIHQAMLCRGFTGQYHRDKLRINKKDSGFLLAVLIISLFVVMGAT
jgi:cobalt/nickel transport system permease protein